MAALIGCPGKSQLAEADASSPAPVEAAAPIPSTTSTVDKAQCESLKKSHTEARDKDALACKTDSDCECYGLCGFNGWGVASKPTAVQLRVIEARAKEQGCVDGIRCAAWSCIPSCIKGKCGVNRP